MQKSEALKKRVDQLENQQLANNNNNTLNANGYLNLKYFSNNSNSPNSTTNNVYNNNNNNNYNSNPNIKTLLPNDNELIKCTNDVLQSLYVLFKNDLSKLDKVSEQFCSYFLWDVFFQNSDHTC